MTTDTCMLNMGQMHLTNVFAIHVVEEAEAVGGRVGDTVGVFRCYVEKGTNKPRLVPFLPWP